MILHKQIKTVEDAASVTKDAGYNMIKQALMESPWATKGEVDEKQIDGIVKIYLEHPDPRTRGLFVCFDDSLLVGLLAGVISNSVVIGSQANELMWYVSKDYRKSGVGIELIKMYEAWARGQGCKLVTMSHYENANSVGLDSVLTANDYQKIEVTYVKELK